MKSSIIFSRRTILTMGIAFAVVGLVIYATFFINSISNSGSMKIGSLSRLYVALLNYRNNTGSWPETLDGDPDLRRLVRVWFGDKYPTLPQYNRPNGDHKSFQSVQILQDGEQEIIILDDGYIKHYNKYAGSEANAYVDRRRYSVDNESIRSLYKAGSIAPVISETPKTP